MTGEWGEYITVNGNRTFFVPDLALPSVEEISDSDCTEWSDVSWQVSRGASASDKGRAGADRVCVKHAHKYPELNAGLVRLRMLLDDPLVQL